MIIEELRHIPCRQPTKEALWQTYKVEGNLGHPLPSSSSSSLGLQGPCAVAHHQHPVRRAWKGHWASSEVEHMMITAVAWPSHLCPSASWAIPELSEAAEGNFPPILDEPDEWRRDVADTLCDEPGPCQA